MDILSTIAESVVIGEVSKIQDLVRAALSEGKSVASILKEGLSIGMGKVGELFKEEEIYVPEVLMAAKTMETAMKVLEPLMLGAEQKPLGKIVLGTVKGDIHNLGKHLVGVMLKGAGFEVIDVGENVPAEKFVSIAASEGSQIIGMSALLTTTMPYMKTVIEAIEKAGLKGRVKSLVGGACLTQRYANEIGADRYAENAGSAVEKAKELIGLK